MGAAAAVMMPDLFDIASRVRQPELKEGRDFLADKRGRGLGTSVTLTGRQRTAEKDEMSAGLVVPCDGMALQTAPWQSLISTIKLKS